MYNSLSVEDILATISEAGFKVAMQKEMQLTREMAEDFYKEHKGQDYFEELITRMTRWSLLIYHRSATIGVEMFCKIFHLMKIKFSKEVPLFYVIYTVKILINYNKKTKPCLRPSLPKLRTLHAVQLFWSVHFRVSNSEKKTD